MPSDMTAKPSELNQALSELAPYFWCAFGFAMFSGFLIFAPTLYMFEVYERVVNSRSTTTLLMLTILVIMAYVVMEVSDWARSETMRWAAMRFDQQLAQRVVDAIYTTQLRQPQGVVSQPMSDFKTLRDFFQNPVIGALMESPMALVFLLTLFAIHPYVGFFALVGGALQFGLTWLNERTTTPALMQANKTAIEAQKYAQNSLRNVEVMQAMGMQAVIQSRWSLKQLDFLALQALASDRAAVFQSLTKLVQTTMSSMLLGLGAYLTLENKLPGGAGTIIVASVLGGRVTTPLVQAVSQWRAVVNARDAWQRLDRLLLQVPAVPAAMPLPAPRGTLTVDNLVAGPPGSNVPLVRGVNLRLEPGQVLAIIGPSASGKTSLARLLSGLWPCMSGKVRLDGVDMHAWRKTELGPYVGYLPQDVEVLQGTVAENIARFGDVDMGQVQEAARAVGLHEFIMKLPLSYDTDVARDGAALSGGYRQRLGLARAFYGKPVFVVLDEPNASLDEAGDAALLKAMEHFKALGATIVVITHRSSVLSACDLVLLMREGMQQAFGPRDEVLSGLRAA